jgi:hypothetical protein
VILSPAIIALLLGSAVTAGMLLYAAGIGVQVLRGWDRTSGSEEQLLLERKTSLASTLLGYLLGFELISLFLFIHTADALHILFTGAMCAAGTLNVNGFGYPALLLKLGNTLAAGLWLVANHADSRGHDFPLVRPRFAALVVMAPFAAAEALLVTLYFLGLKADVITSCCGSLFGGDQGTFAGGIASLPPLPAVAGYYAAAAAVLAAGLRVWLKGKGDLLLGIVTLVFLAAALAALISVLSLYYYEIPTHHCPFCLLQKEYGGIGYLLYGLLLTGGIAGIGCGLLHPARTIPSLHRVVPTLQRRLALTAVTAIATFTLLVTWRLAVSSFMLEW